MGLLFFSVQCIIAKPCASHSVIAAILDFNLDISKRRKQQQYAIQILQIQLLLKIIGKYLLTAIR